MTTATAPTTEKVATVTAALHARILALREDCERLDRSFMAATFADPRVDQKELLRLGADRVQKRAELELAEGDLSAMQSYRDDAAVAAAEERFAALAATRRAIPAKAAAALAAVTAAVTALRAAQDELGALQQQDADLYIQQTAAVRSGLDHQVIPYIGPGLGAHPVPSLAWMLEGLGRDAVTIATEERNRP